jgi:hypothetical protein
VGFFFFSYFLEKDKNSKTPQISFLILIENKNNSKVILESSSIKLTEASGFVISFVHFKHMVMADYNASNNNQWLLDWFKTHAFTIGERQFTII